MASKQSSEDIYEQQKQHFFGNAASDSKLESKEVDSGKTKSYKEELGLTITVDEDEEDVGEQMTFPKSPRQGPISPSGLDSIVELNYEASSDEDSLLPKNV